MRMLLKENFKSIKIVALLIALVLTGLNPVKAAVSEDKKARIRELLQRAKQRRSSSTTSTGFKKIEEKKPDDYQNLINKFDALMNKTKQSDYTKPSQVPVEKKAPIVKPVPAPAPVKAPVVEKPAAVKKPVQPSQPVVQVETKKEIIQPKVVQPVIEKPAPVEVKNSHIESPAPEAKTQDHKKPSNVLDNQRSITPVSSSPSDKNAEYMLVIRKSLKSLEEDSWTEVKYNMGEAIDYFNKERKLYRDPNIDVYYKITSACLRFAEGGGELDLNEVADLEAAESDYLDADDILYEAEKILKADHPNAKSLQDVINTIRRYINEDLEYIEEMLGID